MRVMAQLAMVMNLDKCIGCHTCSVTCKQAWTNRSGVEYVWFNNVETRPGQGYPRTYEDQDTWRGGWQLNRRGRLTLRGGGRFKRLLSLFANPKMPSIHHYYEPWTYDYDHLISAPASDHTPVAQPRSLISGEPMKISWSANWTTAWQAAPSSSPRTRYSRRSPRRSAYESRLLRIGSPMFHYGLLVVIVGHVIGLIIPESWTAAIGVNETLYHVLAVGLGAIAGVATLLGVALLIYRRRTTGPVFSATTVNDKAMYLVLVGAIVLGLLTTLLAGAIGEGYNYRATVSPWFRSIFILQPRGELMAQAPLPFQLHTLIGMLLFAIFPFTRLVHAFTAPIGYLFRPYIVYRSRSSTHPRQQHPSRPTR